MRRLLRQSHTFEMSTVWYFVGFLSSFIVWCSFENQNKRDQVTERVQRSMNRDRCLSANCLSANCLLQTQLSNRLRARWSTNWPRSRDIFIANIINHIVAIISFPSFIFPVNIFAHIFWALQFLVFYLLLTSSPKCDWRQGPNLVFFEIQMSDIAFLGLAQREGRNGCYQCQIKILKFFKEQFQFDDENQYMQYIFNCIEWWGFTRTLDSKMGFFWNWLMQGTSRKQDRNVIKCKTVLNVQQC